jgi:hypothetical protein
MTLKPTDMLEIQSAIDEYERKFPRRPAPSAEVALAWRLGKREAKRRLSRMAPDLAPTGQEPPDSLFAQQECNRLVWAWEQFRIHWQTLDLSEDSPTRFAGLVPWVKGALLVGWWGVFAVAVASVFFFGAIVGGFK